MAIPVVIPIPSQGRAAAAPEDILRQVRELISERFRFLDTSDPHIAVIFDLAVERQNRLVLSAPGKVIAKPKVSPAFHTPKPPQPYMPAVIDASLKMGTLPVVFHRLVEIMNSPYVSPADVANIISVDPALSAKLLRLVNSPFYGLAVRIDTISRAVVLVGTAQLVMLAMGATLITAFNGLPVSLINMQTFWSHSISCGVASRMFAHLQRAPLAESFFVAGLLHDIARLVIYTQLPTHALYLLTEARRRQIRVHDLEEEILGFTHEELGAELLHSWRCPRELVDRVARHHLPLPVSAGFEDAVLPVANMLSQALGFGSSGEVYLFPPEARAWELLKLTPEDLADQCRILDGKVRETRQLLSPSE